MLRALEYPGGMIKHTLWCLARWDQSIQLTWNAHPHVCNACAFFLFFFFWRLTRLLACYVSLGICFGQTGSLTAQESKDQGWTEIHRQEQWLYLSTWVGQMHWLLIILCNEFSGLMRSELYFHTLQWFSFHIVGLLLRSCSGILIPSVLHVEEFHELAYTPNFQIMF